MKEHKTVAELQAELVAIQCEMIASNAEMLGMEAENSLRTQVNESPAYGASSFNECRNQLLNLSSQAGEVAKQIGLSSREVPTVAEKETVQETPPSVGDRPSNDLLWQAWVASKGEEGYETIQVYKPTFDKWVAGLPADPLEADRKLLQDLLDDGVVSAVTFTSSTIGEADKFYKAFTRVIGYGN